MVNRCPRKLCAAKVQKKKKEKQIEVACRLCPVQVKMCVNFAYFIEKALSFLSCDSLYAAQIEMWCCKTYMTLAWAQQFCKSGQVWECQNNTDSSLKKNVGLG